MTDTHSQYVDRFLRFIGLQAICGNLCTTAIVVVVAGFLFVFNRETNIFSKIDRLIRSVIVCQLKILSIPGTFEWRDDYIKKIIRECTEF